MGTRNKAPSNKNQERDEAVMFWIVVNIKKGDDDDNDDNKDNDNDDLLSPTLCHF